MALLVLLARNLESFIADIIVDCYARPPPNPFVLVYKALISIVCKAAAFMNLPSTTFGTITLLGNFLPVLRATESAILSAWLVAVNLKVRDSSFCSCLGLKFMIRSSLSIVSVRRLGELSKIALRSKASYNINI